MSSAFADPILVFTLARSKSSLVTATIVDALGAWVGSCNGAQPGYPRGQLENRRLRDLQRAWFGRAWRVIDEGGWIEGRDGFREAVIDTIRDDGYPGGPWVRKVSALYAPAYLHAFPDATMITVRRSRQAVLDSARRHHGTIPSERVIHAHERIMDNLGHLHAIELWPDERPGNIGYLHQRIQEIHGVPA